MDCYMSMANILCWPQPEAEMAVEKGFLFIRYMLPDHILYLEPVPFEFDADLRLSVYMLLEDAKINELSFLMYVTSFEMRDLIRNEFADSLSVKPDRDSFNYIYSRQRQESLSGKKFTVERRQINLFLRHYPLYEYKHLVSEHFEACLKMESLWNLSEEMQAINNMFKHWDAIGMTGGTLFVEGKMIAFIIGNPINEETLDFNIYKSDKNYIGSSTMMTHEFICHLPSNFKYINMEEDLGIYGLRQRKSVLSPDFLLEKYIVKEKGDTLEIPLPWRIIV